MSNKDILISIDFTSDAPMIWHYFRGCPEILVHIRPRKDSDVFVEHKQKDSHGNWSQEYDGPELRVAYNTLFDMVSAGVEHALIGKGYAGAEAIYIDELPKSSQDFIINELHLGDYVKRSDEDKV